MIFAPLAISSRNASGKARSQQTRMPTGPRGVWIVSCGACVEEVRCGRSGCLCGGRKWSIEKVHGVKGEARRMPSERKGVPEVLFLIPAQYLPFITNEIGNIMQLILSRLFLHMRFHNSPWHYTNFEFLCQLLVSNQIILPLLAKERELRIFRHPIREMIFGENGELSAFCSSGSYEVGCVGDVVGGVKGLWEDEPQLVVVTADFDVNVRTLGWSWMTAIL